MKKWKDADEVIKMIHDLENENLRMLDREMSKKPNFDHYQSKCIVKGCNNKTRTQSRLCAKHIDKLIGK